MTVREFRETLAQLVRLLEAADAKKATVTGLAEFIEATTTFGDLTLKAFVKLAEAGRTPAAPKPSPTRKPRATADAAGIAAEVKDLYDRAGEAGVTEEQIRAACGRLAPVDKDSLVALANEIGLVGMKSRTKPQIVAGITERLLDRKGAAIRRQLIDRPDTADADGVPASAGGSSPFRSA